MTLCVDLDAVEASTPPAAARAAGADAGAEPAGPPAAALPVRPLLGLAGSGVFAVWTSLTCFVC